MPLAPEELVAWRDRFMRLLPTQDQGRVRYTIEPKIDGLSVVLHYEDGRFVLGATRGDGEVGEDITANLRTVKSLPLILPAGRADDPPAVPRRLVVRGEAYVSVADFRTFNAGKRRRASAPTRIRATLRPVLCASSMRASRRRGRSASGSTRSSRWRAAAETPPARSGRRWPICGGWVSRWSHASGASMISRTCWPCAAPGATPNGPCCPTRPMGWSSRSMTWRYSNGWARGQGSALGRRLQVSCRRGRHPAARHPGECGAHRHAQPIRGARPRAGGRRDGHECDAT